MQHNCADDNLRDYYARRAHEYERIYDKPERQADLASLRESIPSLLDGRDVLEVACGTGYWTQPVAMRAASVLATDVNEEVLELARRKSYPRDNVAFELLDIYSEGDLPRRFNAGLAAFWWSHVPRQSYGRFIEHFHRRLQSGAIVVFLDNRYVQGSSTPLSRTDEHGNTYQTRTLDDGTSHEVLKNIPDESELAGALGNSARALEYVELDYFWYVSYRVISAL
jgi:demethylmenaquinone methyltransferase/2-methoxy-6-polyprenyl-1,4-benzoquinol methylase